MRYAVIAAGEGSRLKQEGITMPKPLVEIGGESLIDRLIRIFIHNDAEEIVVICNDLTAQVASHLARLQRDGLRGRPVPLRFMVKSTPSSMHSLWEISPWLRDAPFILTTVDTIFDETEFSHYAKAFEQSSADGLMGVTDYIEDEKPLYVGVDERHQVTGYYDEPAGCQMVVGAHPCGRPSYVSAGIYGLRPAALDILSVCVSNGEQRMRNFQRALLRGGQQLEAFAFSQVLDIDHVSDIARAEMVVGAHPRSRTM